MAKVSKSRKSTRGRDTLSTSPRGFKGSDLAVSSAVIVVMLGGGSGRGPVGEPPVRSCRSQSRTSIASGVITSTTLGESLSASFWTNPASTSLATRCSRADLENPIFLAKSSGCCEPPERCSRILRSTGSAISDNRRLKRSSSDKTGQLVLDMLQTSIKGLLSMVLKERSQPMNTDLLGRLVHFRR